jgi:lipoprotein-anchoring transpeptidase ErfK/SrfK
MIGIMWKYGTIMALLLICAGINTGAQGYVDQEAVASVVESQNFYMDRATPVGWHRYNVGKAGRSNKTMLARLKAHLDSLPGEREDHRLEIVELSNRVRGQYMMQKGTIIVPNEFPRDFRAYSPYPQHYDSAEKLPKLFVIDKYTQTFAAYEYGHLVRWGLVSTGHEDDLTPTGRYNFNWKQEYRESTAAPEGEIWRLRWVFNFEPKAGIHVHQYVLPIATPASHGCVRLTESDAYWNYNWSSEWVMEGGKVQQPGTPVIVINNNPAGLSAHWQDNGSGGIQSLVKLPPDPMSVPVGKNAVSDVVSR